MHTRHRVSRRKICGGLLAGIALVALGGCYPYYYDLHYSHGDRYYKRDHHGKRRYYGHGRRHHRDRRWRHRRRRYKYYRH